MNRGRIIKVVAVALLISMVFPLIVAAEPPPPGEPSPLSPVIMPNESFEGFVFPPSGWKVIQTNTNQTWMQLGLSYFLPHSGVQAAVVIADADPQDEVLLTPKVSGAGMAVIFSSMTLDVAKCKPEDGVCDLEVWLVKGAWDVGAGNDVLLGTVDSAWTENGEWEFTAYIVDLSRYYRPVRIGFRYKGQAGGWIAVDDVTIIAYQWMNRNPSFEDGGKMPKAWQGKNLTALDKRDNNKFKTGSWSFKMKGSRAKKSLFQAMDYPGYANDILAVMGCSKSNNAKAGRPYQVVATIFHRDGSRERHKIKFTPGTHGWECKAKGILTKEPYKRIKLEIRYWRQTGKAWFDDVVVAH